MKRALVILFALIVLFASACTRPPIHSEVPWEYLTIEKDTFFDIIINYPDFYTAERSDNLLILSSGTPASPSGVAQIKIIYCGEYDASDDYAEESKYLKSYYSDFISGSVSRVQYRDIDGITAVGVEFNDLFRSVKSLVFIFEGRMYHFESIVTERHEGMNNLIDPVIRHIKLIEEGN